MKKLVAVALALVMILTMSCAAFAEARTFVLTYVTDSEGIDLEVEELPELVVTIDDETMTCIYATAEGEEEGTVEVLEVRPMDEESGAPACVTIQVTLADGDVVVMFVYEDQVEMFDAEHEIYYILMPVQEVVEAA